MNNKGYGPVSIIITVGALAAGMLFNAVSKADLPSPQWDKAKTIDTVANPAVPEWDR